MTQHMQMEAIAPAKPHPVTVEVVRNSIVAYADEMANALCKSAYNMMIYEVRDFCCGLIDIEGRMISQNRGGLPIFSLTLVRPWRMASGAGGSTASSPAT